VATLEKLFARFGAKMRFGDELPSLSESPGSITLCWREISTLSNNSCCLRNANSSLKFTTLHFRITFSKNYKLSINADEAIPQGKL